MNAQMQLTAKTSPESSFTSVRAGLIRRKQRLLYERGIDCPECHSGLPDPQRSFTMRAETSSVPPIVHEVLNSPGEPLDSETRAYMEPRFGHDFSKVRVHKDGKAAESALILGALAYSVDRQIVFGKERFAPLTFSGKQLLAHELAHVAQADGKQTAPSKIARPSSLWEREASRAASAVSQGQAFRVSGGAPSQIYRVADPRLETYLQRLRELSREMAGPLRSEYVVEQLLSAVSELDLSDPDNLRPVVQTISESFSADILLEFLEQVESSQPRRREPDPEEAARMERTVQLMQVQRRGAYGQYGPGVVLPVVSQAARPLLYAGRSLAAFFEGLLAGLRGNISDADIQALNRRLAASSVVNITLPVVIVSGAAVGIVEDIANAIRGIVEIIGNISEIAEQVLNLLELMVSEEGAEIARALGTETGRNYANRVRELTRFGPIRFTYELGRLIGPMVVYTILSIVTSGAVAGAAVSARLAGLLSRFPRFTRLLTRIGSRLRRIRRRRHADAPERRRHGDGESETPGSRPRHVPGLSRCRVGSLFCPIDFLRQEFSDIFEERNTAEFANYIRSYPDLDLSMGRSLRANQTILTGDRMYVQFLREVPEAQWSPAFRAAMARARRNMDYREISIGGNRYRWPLDDLGSPWPVHHDPPLGWVTAESNQWWHPMPYRIHDNAHRWWGRLQARVRNRVPAHMRRAILEDDIDIRDL